MAHSPETRHALTAAWQYREAQASLSIADNLMAEDGWRPATVPGTVYQDLIASGDIPDPYIGLNEQAVQWVADRDWCYRLDFDYQADLAHPYTDLVCEGLDTFAQVWLNGQEILRSTNMFVPARLAVQQLLRPGRNRLAIYFASALRSGREIEAHLGKRHLWNGDSSRLYVRKAQYHYGWDWGPTLLTAGPWRPISLHRYSVRIADLACPIWLAPDFSHARIDLTTALAGDVDALSAQATLEHRLFAPDGALIATAQAPLQQRSSMSLAVTAPRLWWPAGQGEQALYTVESRVLLGDILLAYDTRRLGLRTVRLVQEAVTGESGRSFYFEINGRALFAGGANWIPDDNLLNRITPARYRTRIEQALTGHMRMLRVWGGGIYEDEAFYDTCDELGILVWQDFLFACGHYPAHPEFLASVRAEAHAAISRLRHHPSLVLWCGNNEDYTLAESIGIGGEQGEGHRFDGRIIYESLLPALCADLDGQRPYWPGSPYSPSSSTSLDSNDPLLGDRHSWEVWHKEMLPYQRYGEVQGRFVSEFGMQSHPSLPLLERTIPETERFALSCTMSAHNKAGSPGAPDGHRRLAVYMADTLHSGTTLADAVYASQFVQAEAMRYAYQDFRQRWHAPGRRAVGGALVWQLNDCWPATSWAVIDSSGLEKPAWHVIRRSLAPCAIAVRQAPEQARGWLMLDAGQASEVRLVLDVFGMDGEHLYYASQWLSATENGSTDFAFALPSLPAASIMRMRCLHNTYELCRDLAWPEPYRFHRMPESGISAIRDSEQHRLLLRSQMPVKGLWLASAGLHFADNFLDLMPDETIAVPIRGDLAQPIAAQSLDQDLVWL